MNRARTIGLLCLLILCSLATLGCGKKEKDRDTDAAANVAAAAKGGQVDASKPMSEVQAEADKMDVEQLRSIAMKYKEVAETKTAEVEKAAQELMASAVADMAGDKTKELNAKMKQMSASLEALTKRFEVYYNKLKEKGGDVSGFGI